MADNDYAVPYNFVSQYDDGQKKICANQVDENFDWILANIPPTGSLIWIAKQAVPSGYLLCNGAAVSRSTYSGLFSAIGTTYGIGDGSTTFNLPYLIDRFVEGSSTAGTLKNAGLPNIAASLKVSGGNNQIFSVETSGSFYGGGYSEYRPVISAQSLFGGDSIAYFDASRSSSIYGGSTTVQPTALTMLPCIKY